MGNGSATSKGVRGFTIVELLIVIVVIAILAAITIVAYNGIQQRTENQKTISATKEYIKAYYAYGEDNGDYPGSGCLGEIYTSNPGGRCLSQSGTAECFSLGSAVSQTPTTALKPYMNNQAPAPSTQSIDCGGTKYIGVYSYYNPANKEVTVVMLLKGDHLCPAMSPNVRYTAKMAEGNGMICRYTLAAM